MIPTFDQNNQTVNNATTLTGMADANSEVDINLNGNAYITYADALGNWSQAITLEGAPSPGLQYTVTIISRSTATGLISAEFQGLVNLLETTKTISFNFNYILEFILVFKRYTSRTRSNTRKLDTNRI